MQYWKSGFLKLVFCIGEARKPLLSYILIQEIDSMGLIFEFHFLQLFFCWNSGLNSLIFFFLPHDPQRIVTKNCAPEALFAAGKDNMCTFVLRSKEPPSPCIIIGGYNLSSLSHYTFLHFLKPRATFFQRACTKNVHRQDSFEQSMITPTDIY